MKLVLLIDASPMFREFLKGKLLAEQVNVETAVGNRDAYTKMITTLPDLVIIDVQENMDNLQEFLAKKCDDPNAKKIPIIISGPQVPRTQVATLAKFAVVKYFTKPIKFDVFFESIGKILHTNFAMDTTPSILEMHVNGSIIFMEIAQGLNREKLFLVKYKLNELIENNNIHEPKLVIMMTNLKLTFIDGSNLELLFDNIIATEKIKLKNIKILSFDQFTRELIDGHPQYSGIEIADNLNDVLNSLVDRTRAVNMGELISAKILTSDSKSNQDGSLEMRFQQDALEKLEDIEEIGNVLKIAVIDDDLIIRKLVENAFKQAGVETELFASGLEFVKSLDTKEFDLIILDIFIPDMNGLDILRTIQSKQITTPVIIYSQATQKDAVIKALSLGAKSYLVKPLKPEVLVTKAMETIHS